MRCIKYPCNELLSNPLLFLLVNRVEVWQFVVVLQLLKLTDNCAGDCLSNVKQTCHVSIQ